MLVDDKYSEEARTYLAHSPKTANEELLLDFRQHRESFMPSLLLYADTAIRLHHDRSRFW